MKTEKPFTTTHRYYSAPMRIMRNEIERKEAEQLKKEIDKLKPTLDKISTEETVKNIREDRNNR